MRGAFALVVYAAVVTPVLALPTMVRLGYPNCASCHVSPQGGGLLNVYGRGIDEAQSLRAGEYDPNLNKVPSSVSAGGRLDQDFRVVLSESVTRLPGGSLTSAFRSRFYYRTVTTLGKGLRFTATLAGENEPSPRRPGPLEPAFVPGQAFVPIIELQYRPKEGIELAVGRDQLPTGIYTGDTISLVKSRNRYGLYDNPLQAKLFLWSKRWQVIPYAFAPGGMEADQARERGGGLLAEYDLSGKGNTVVGVNFLHGSDKLGNRNLGSFYTRLGFGQWGILAEHDLTRRSYPAETGRVGFGQSATYVQGFRAFREWLVGSLIFERLAVAAPYRESLIGARAELFARLTPNFTTGVRTGFQYDRQTGRAAPVLTLQLAWKTVGLKPW